MLQSPYIQLCFCSAIFSKILNKIHSLVTWTSRSSLYPSSHITGLLGLLAKECTTHRPQR